MALDQMVLLLALFAIFYFVMIRPQQKQQKEFAQMLKDLKKNDQVVTVGGVHGTIVNLKEKTLVIRVDSDTRFEIDKTAVARLVKAAT